MRRAVALAAVVLALASCAERPQEPGAAGRAVTAPDGFRRIARTSNHNVTLTCADPTECLLSRQIATWRVPDPPGKGAYRLVITVTLSYRLSGGDTASIGISTSCPITNPPAPCPYPSAQQVRPIAPAAGPTTTTFTWAVGPADGQGWYLPVLADLGDRDGDGSVRLIVRNVTAIFEMWPA